MDVKEFLARYKVGERDFRGVSLYRADLRRFPLDGVDFSGAIFQYVKFCGHYTDCVNSHINFSGAKFWSCDITGEFSFCDFRNTNIGSCNLESTRFSDCDWRGAKTKYCNMTRTHFVRVNLQGVTWGGYGEEPCRFWDVIRDDGVFIPGFTFELYPLSFDL
ncbi:MAG: pentapeptide repeat-containing protein [Cyanobacteriota bacterium]|nr:pentapeptide repeat-containing protein [Cyanobacteriota bacterium]